MCKSVVHWYQPIVVYTSGKYKFLFLLPKVNKHESGFRFRKKMGQQSGNNLNKIAK